MVLLLCEEIFKRRNSVKPWAIGTIFNLHLLVGIHFLRDMEEEDVTRGKSGEFSCLLTNMKKHEMAGGLGGWSHSFNEIMKINSIHFIAFLGGDDICLTSANSTSGMQREKQTVQSNCLRHHWRYYIDKLM